jgi:hypothetical protein
MISTHDLLEIKSRLIVGADAARKIASSTDPVFYDQEQYERVYAALVSMSQDLGRILAELDVLRGMFYSGVSLFLASEMNGNGLPKPVGNVESVPAQEAGSGSQGEPPVGKGTDGGVSASGPTGKRSKRSKPRRNKAGHGVLPVEVGSSDGAAEVDRSADA